MPKLYTISYSHGHVSPQHHLCLLTIWPVTADTGNTQMSAGCQWPVVGKWQNDSAFKENALYFTTFHTLTKNSNSLTTTIKYDARHSHLSNNTIMYTLTHSNILFFINICTSVDCTHSWFWSPPHNTQLGFNNNSQLPQNFLWFYYSTDLPHSHLLCHSTLDTVLSTTPKVVPFNLY